MKYKNLPTHILSWTDILFSYEQFIRCSNWQTSFKGNAVWLKAVEETEPIWREGRYGLASCILPFRKCPVSQLERQSE